MNDEITHSQAYLFDNGTVKKQRIPLIRETTCRLFLNGRHVTSNACAGLFLEEWAVGYLKTSGIITSMNDVQHLERRDNDILVNIGETAGSHVDLSYRGSSGSFGSPPDVIERKAEKEPLLRAEQLFQLMENFLLSTYLHTKTSGTHGAALATASALIITREDIGRHNAIDMIVGHALLNDVDCSDKIVLTTGRISSEIVRKVSHAGAPVILSHSAATSRAVADALRSGITAIGRTRRTSMTLYSHFERIIQ